MAVSLGGGSERKCPLSLSQENLPKKAKKRAEACGARRPLWRSKTAGPRATVEWPRWSSVLHGRPPGSTSPRRSAGSSSLASAVAVAAVRPRSTCRRAHCRQHALELRDWSCLHSGCVLGWVVMPPGRGRHGHDRAGSVGLASRDSCAKVAHVGTLVRLWASVVPRAHLVSCRVTCVDREVNYLVSYKAMGRNFSPPTRGPAT